MTRCACTRPKPLRARVCAGCRSARKTGKNWCAYRPGSQARRVVTERKAAV